MNTATDRLDWTSPETWQGTRQPLERATGLHPAAYTSPDYFEREQELVFGRAQIGCEEALDDVARDQGGAAEQQGRGGAHVRGP